MEENNSLRIVYMGTPDFAVEPLEALLDAGFNVVGVVTMPDKPAGRGHHLQASPVKRFALEHDLPLLQPERLRDEDFLINLKMWDADIQVVVAFRMLPEVVWNMPRLGTVNLHASLLPQYRGAAPINWAIINGESQTGVTTFFLKHEIDTGDMVLQETVDIAPDDTAGTLHDKLMHVGSRLLVKTLEQVSDDSYDTVLQDETKAVKPAPKIFKEDCRIQWDQPVEKIHNFVRGLSPYPAAFTEVRTGKEAQVALKIFAGRVSGQPCHAAPGTLDTDGRNYLRFAAADGWLEVLSAQLPGKKVLDIRELLRGTKFN
ncbi:MAG: methionyl-tRNA formyltransferase [Paludibacteraceae bacterium]|nr:methionyl-tRNA formyltransferase [Paludibacteraceae bacterium]